MEEAKRTEDDATQVEATSGGVGDVESAGETTAAAAIKGPTDNKPVGADTLVKVAGDTNPSTSDND
ncbi:MAG TPA: hypothetical protein VF658_10475 [Pyrinomonadaceae bacterium]|jgi:hypothetical protein